VTDLQTREVSDWLCYASVFAGLGLAALAGAYTENWIPIISRLMGCLVFFAIGAALFYTRQWGGGDVGILTVTGSFIGLQLSLDGIWLAFLMNLLLCGAAYSIVWLVCLAIRHHHAFRKQFTASMNLFSWVRYASAAGVLVTLVLFAMMPYWPMLAIAVLFPILFYLLPFSHAVQLSCLQYYAKPDKLTLGDWIGEDIKAEGKTIVSKESTGLSAAEINKVQELHDKGKVGNVLVKTGIPFIPSFLIAFVVTLWHGSLLTFVLHLLL
jgi:prepilin signal peptidase PulO-like enzyme (type II secretory pathway)